MREERVANRQQRRQYEIFWEREADLPERVANAWREAGGKRDLGDIMHGLDNVMVTLQDWSKKRFGNILKELGKARKHLEVLQLSNADQHTIRQATDHMLSDQMLREQIKYLLDKQICIVEGETVATDPPRL
jgi:hypothetical protein